MSFDVIWDDPSQRILRIIYPEDWSWDAVYATEAQVSGLLSDSPRSFGILHDLSAVGHDAHDAMHHMRGLVRCAHPQMQVCAVTGHSGFVMRIWATFRKALQQSDPHYAERSFVLAHDLQEAREQVYAALATFRCLDTLPAVQSA